MADSSARNLNYQQVQEQEAERSGKKIVLNPKKIPLSKLEKTLLILGAIITMALMVAIVSTSVKQTYAQHRLANIEQSVISKQNKNVDLGQEIGNLSSTTRMNKIAKEKGLSLIESNIRNIR